MESFTYISPREKLLLRRFAAGLPDNKIATELGDKPRRIAAQRERLAEKFDIRTPEQLGAVADRLAHHPSWKPSATRRNSGNVRLPVSEREPTGMDGGQPSAAVQELKSR